MFLRHTLTVECELQLPIILRASQRRETHSFAMVAYFAAADRRATSREQPAPSNVVAGQQIEV